MVSSASGGDVALPRRKRAIDEAVRALRELYTVDWKPAGAPSSRSTADDLAGVQAPQFGGDAIATSSRSGGGGATKSSSSAARKEGTQRRALAIAGPSGVRLSIPPLTVLCMEVSIRARVSVQC